MNFFLLAFVFTTIAAHKQLDDYKQLDDLPVDPNMDMDCVLWNACIHTVHVLKLYSSS